MLITMKCSPGHIAKRDTSSFPKANIVIALGALLNYYIQKKAVRAYLHVMYWKLGFMSANF